MCARKIGGRRSLQTADERYDAMLAEFPPAVSRLRQHLLASYLGVAPESLSRMLRGRRRP